jgi:hypothetical protein
MLEYDSVENFRPITDIEQKLRKLYIPRWLPFDSYTIVRNKGKYRVTIDQVDKKYKSVRCQILYEHNVSWTEGWMIKGENGMYVLHRDSGPAVIERNPDGIIKFKEYYHLGIIRPNRGFSWYMDRLDKNLTKYTNKLFENLGFVKD